MANLAKMGFFHTLMNQAADHKDESMKLFASNMFFYYAFDDPKFLNWAKKYRRVISNA